MQVQTKENAQKRAGSSLVRREVTRVVTRGTLTEDALLAPHRVRIPVNRCSPHPQRFYLHKIHACIAVVVTSSA